MALILTLIGNNSVFLFRVQTIVAVIRYDASTCTESYRAFMLLAPIVVITVHFILGLPTNMYNFSLRTHIWSIYMTR